jgi:hypothetical protein
LTLKWTITLLLLIVFQYPLVYGQSKHVRTHETALDLQLPLGDFTSTHLFGAGLSYQSQPDWTRKLSFRMLEGFECYFGKQETVSTYYDFKNGSYLVFFVLPAAQLRLSKKVYLAIHAGPALGLHLNNLHLNMMSSVRLFYRVSNKLLVGPVVYYLKEGGAEALWSAGIRTGFLF